MFLGVPGTLRLMNETERISLGKRIAAARKRRGWSKERVAEVAGITTTTLRRMESGLRVQDAKLQVVVDLLELDVDSAGMADRYGEHEIAPELFVLPPEVEIGYNETVKFSAAVRRWAPHLSGEATRLMLDAASLFARTGEALLVEGGDGHADASAGGSAPTSQAAYDLAANETTPDQQEPGAAEGEAP
jgi:transcriptional regulator with XRE-family HTH domain